jgi:hypothetical protein
MTFPKLRKGPPEGVEETVSEPKEGSAAVLKLTD